LEVKVEGGRTSLDSIMSTTEEQLVLLLVGIQDLAMKVERVVQVFGGEVQGRKNEVKIDENNVTIGLLGNIIAKVAPGCLDFSDPVAVCNVFETSYACAKTRQEIDPLCQKLRKIYVDSSKAWREASRAAARPIEGILVNPDCRIHHKVKTTVALLAADRANAIYGVKGGWTKGHVDPRLSNIVDVVLPILISEAPAKHQEQLYSWLTCAQEIIGMAD